MHFTWDPRKDAVNRRKHGVPFSEATKVFFDDRALLIDDTDHSDSEERFILLGAGSGTRLLVVVHAYRSDDFEIRIISARRANRHESQSYRERKSK